MIDRKKLFDLCRFRLSCSYVYKSYVEISIMAQHVHVILERQEMVLGAEDLNYIRKFFLSAVGYINSNELPQNVARYNSDYEIYYALKSVIFENDKCLRLKFLESVADKSAFAVLAFLYPTQYAFLPESVLSLMRVIFRDIAFEAGLARDVISTPGAEYVNQEVIFTNQNLCITFNDFGFDSPAQFSAYISALNVFLRRNVFLYKLGAGKNKEEKLELKLEKFVIGDFKVNDESTGRKE